MGKFSEVQAERDKIPERIITLTPAAFADDYASRPTGEVAIGLRRLSQQDTAYARGEAEREAVDFYKDVAGRPRRPDLGSVEDVRNDALMCVAVGRACTDPNDVTQPYFRGLEDRVRIALTPDGVRRVWDEYVLFTAASGVARQKASDAEAKRIALAIASGLVTLDDEARMLLAYLGESLRVDELQELPDEGDGEGAEVDLPDAGETEYVVRTAMTTDAEYVRLAVGDARTALAKLRGADAAAAREFDVEADKLDRLQDLFATGKTTMSTVVFCARQFARRVEEVFDALEDPDS